MKVLVDITEGRYEVLKAMADVGLGYYDKAILNGTPIPDKATNGDVFRTMFPLTSIMTDGAYVHIEWETERGKEYAGFKASWWNAPYQTSNDDGTRPFYANEWN